MSKTILITGGQGSGKTILTNLMSYEHERLTYDELRRKQQLAVCKELKGLDKVIIDDIYPDDHNARIVDICKNMEINAIFVSNVNVEEFDNSLFDIIYRIEADFKTSSIKVKF